MSFPFNLKLRSLPNTHTYKEYVDIFLRAMGLLLGFNFIYICLFTKGFMPLLPTWYFIGVIGLMVNKYREIELRNKTITKEDMKDIIINIRLGQMQSFREKCEERPEFLKANYKGHSLLYWSKKYNREKANKIIIELMNKEINKNKKAPEKGAFLKLN